MPSWVIFKSQHAAFVIYAALGVCSQTVLFVCMCSAEYMPLRMYMLLISLRDNELKLRCNEDQRSGIETEAVAFNPFVESKALCACMSAWAV